MVVAARIDVILSFASFRHFNFAHVRIYFEERSMRRRERSSSAPMWLTCMESREFISAQNKLWRGLTQSGLDNEAPANKAGGS